MIRGLSRISVEGYKVYYSLELIFVLLFSFFFNLYIYISLKTNDTRRNLEGKHVIQFLDTSI